MDPVSRDEEEQVLDARTVPATDKPPEKYPVEDADRDTAITDEEMVNVLPIRVDPLTLHEELKIPEPAIETSEPVFASWATESDPEHRVDPLTDTVEPR